MIKCPKCGGSAEIKNLCDSFENLHTCDNCRYQFKPLKENTMQSNTKLTPEQKIYLGDLKAAFTGSLVENRETTIAYIERGNTVEFALAVMSPDEKKFRAKVGEYHALRAFENGSTVKMAQDDFRAMLAGVLGIYI